MLDRDNILYLMNLSILTTCWLHNLWILWGEVKCLSLLGVKELITVDIRRTKSMRVMDKALKTAYLNYLSV